MLALGVVVIGKAAPPASRYRPWHLCPGFGDSVLSPYFSIPVVPAAAGQPRRAGCPLSAARRE